MEIIQDRTGGTRFLNSSSSADWSKSALRASVLVAPRQELCPRACTILNKLLLLLLLPPPLFGRAATQ